MNKNIIWLSSKTAFSTVLRLCLISIALFFVTNAPLTVFAQQTTYDSILDSYNEGGPQPPTIAPRLQFQLPVEILSRDIPPVDIVFAIDNTGSMCGTIDTVKADVQEIADKIRVQVPDSNFGSIKFRDYGDDYITEIVTQPTSSIDDFKDGINTHICGGGADWPEAYVETVIQGVEEITWRESALKLLVVLGDAPPHDPVYGTGTSGSGKTWAQAANHAVLGSVVVSMVAVGYGVGNDTVEESYQYMANSTGGIYVESSDPSEVSNALINLVNELSTEKPVVSSTYPEAYATGVPVTTYISATFNLDMDASTINNSTIYLDNGYMCLNITVDYNSETKTATITPMVDLEKNVEYTVILMDAIKSADGKCLSIYSWTFTTEELNGHDRVVMAIQSIKEMSYETVNAQKDRVATIVSTASKELKEHDEVLFFNAVASALAGYAGGSAFTATHFGHLAGVPKNLAILLAKTKDVKQNTALIFNTISALKLKYRWDVFNDWDEGGDLTDPLYVRDCLENKYEIRYYKSLLDGTIEITKPLPSDGIKGVRESIEDTVTALIAGLPTTISEEKASQIVNFIQEQRLMLFLSQNAEVLPNWCDIEGVCKVKNNKPLGHLISHEQELDGALVALYKEEAAKIGITAVKTVGMIMKVGGIAGCWAGGGVVFVIGESLFWGPQVADAVWTGLEIMDITLTAKEAVHHVLLDVTSALRDEMVLTLEYVTNSLAEVERIIEGTSLVSKMYSKPYFSARNVRSSDRSLEVLNFQTPNITQGSATSGTATLTLKNNGTNSFLCMVNAKLLGPEGTDGDKIIFGLVSLHAPVEIIGGGTNDIEFEFPGMPFPTSGFSGTQIAAEISLTDQTTGDSQVLGPFLSTSYMVTPEEEEIIAEVVSENELEGEVTPGMRQEMIVSVPSGNSRLLFTLTVAEGTDADLHLFDLEGNHTGYDYGQMNSVTEIPDSTYSGPDVKSETITVTNPAAGNYVLRVVGKAGTASFVVRKLGIPVMAAKLLADNTFSQYATPGQAVDGFLKAWEAGGSADVSGLAVSKQDLNNGAGGTIPASYITIGEFDPNIPKGDSLLIPISIQVPADIEAGEYTGTLTLNSSAGSRECIVKVHVIPPISLHANWNLISFPYLPNSISWSEIMDGAAGKYESIWAYLNGEWKAYVPDEPGFSDLSDFYVNAGYWVKATQTCSLVVPTDGLIDPPTIALVSGWNLVRNLSNEEMPTADALASIAGKFVSVWAYINGEWKVYDPVNPGFSDLTTMEPGYGYWINATESCTWTLP